MNKHSLKDKAVLVGGGAKNLGGLISRTFAADGAKICVHYNSASTKAEADKCVADIKAAGGEAFATRGDFTRVADVVAAFAQAKKRFGGIDIAINTVGKVLKKPFVETTEAEYDAMAQSILRRLTSSSRKQANSSTTEARFAPSSRRCSLPTPACTQRMKG
jgi:NAD(P)-dependent dehydrogenase (short-subunit alcohol dehydrogenase family)